jgi:hypothetical protein
MMIFKTNMISAYTDGKGNEHGGVEIRYPSRNLTVHEIKVHIEGKVGYLMLTTLDEEIPWAVVGLNCVDAGSPNRPADDKSTFPSYHDMLDYMCTVLNIPGSPDFYEAVAYIKSGKFTTCGNIHMDGSQHLGTVARCQLSPDHDGPHRNGLTTWEGKSP